MIQNYGPVEIVGSYASNLMTWRDIDLQFPLETTDDKQILFKIAKDIGVTFAVKRLVFNNHRLRDESPFDYGLYLGTQLIHENQHWKVDLWCVEPEHFERSMAEHRSQITALKNIDRAAILALKFALIERGDYRNTVWSVDLYNAMLEDGVRTTEDFDVWWQEHSGT